ncbi:MAG: DUF1553 domain-containing protein [Verrucomicrobiales bacterium]|nr:DUF1553 domain-containing protein [Verrucomicrobiales bacterium]
MKSFAAGFCLFCFAFSSALADPKIPQGQLDFFEKKIRPVLVENCYSCHSKDEKIKGGLRLDSKDATLMGGDTGPAIEPGEPGSSLLVEAIEWGNDDLQMPPKHKLKPNEIADLKRWIQMGAPDPRTGGSKAGTVTKSEIDYEKGREHWIYQPVKKPAGAKKLDEVVLAKLKAEGLEPVGIAEPEKLVRRLYFDLIGLPPSPPQANAFFADVKKLGREKAVAKLTDQLLNSPHFGERWGRHWLDVVRYAESNGMERNFLYPKAWKYRDYVIASFNNDKPFDQFAKEQIAGDFTNSDEAKIATGFLAIGPKMLNERDKEVFGYEVIDEQIDATSRAFLGLTVSCARCHDHKFDAISQADYYKLAGIFRSTTTHFGTKAGGGNRQASTLMAVGENAEKKAAAWKEYNQKLAQANKVAKQRQGKVNGTKKRLAALKKQKKPPAQISKMEAEMAELTKEMKASNNRIDFLKKNRPPVPDYAMGVTDREKPVDSPLLIRGNPETKAEVVPRGIPAVFEPVTGLPKIAPDASGRLELANWIADGKNPLTARVMANRIWTHLLGDGIVPTVDNFGESGQAPSNVELLDFLAASFMESGWSVKNLIREIVTSDAYQRSSGHHEKNYEIDPDNRFVWRQSLRRLDAESIRDSILTFAGELDPSPRDGSVVDQMGDRNFGRDKKATELLRKGIGTTHRSVYLPIIRNATPTGLKIFDFAESSLIVGKRNETNVPSQALFMMNSGFITNNSKKIAERVCGTDGKVRKQNELIWRGFQLVLGRSPSEEETARAAQLIASHENPDDGLITFCQALISSAEFRYLN